MALSIVVKEEYIDDPDLFLLGQKFRARSASNENHPLGTIYNFTLDGELKFSTEAYAICDTGGRCIMSEGMFYAIISDPTAMTPDTYPDGGGQLTYAEYFNPQSQYQLADGTWLFRVVRGTNGLSDADRLIYQADLGTLLVKAYGLSLIPDEVVA